MGKTIVIKEQLKFHELIEWCTKNNIRCMGYKSNDYQRVEVEVDGSFTFDHDAEYGSGETYEVDIYHEVTMECKYELLVEILVYNRKPNTYLDASVNDIIGDDTKEIHAFINGQFYKILDIFEE